MKVKKISLEQYKFHYSWISLCILENNANHEVTKFLQNYVDSEVNINADASCKLTCGDYQKTRHFGCRSDTFCANENAVRRKALGCNGIVRECKEFEDELSICPAVSNSK